MAEATLSAKHNRRHLHQAAGLPCIGHIQSVAAVSHLYLRNGQKDYHQHVKVDSTDHTHKHKRPEKDAGVLESRAGRYTSSYRKPNFHIPLYRRIAQTTSGTCFNGDLVHCRAPTQRVQVLSREWFKSSSALKGRPWTEQFAISFELKL